MNTIHHQYPRCHHRRHYLQLQIGGGVKKAAMVEKGAEVMEEVVQRMKNCRSPYAHRSYIESSSYTLWTVSATTIAAYLSCGTHTAPCTSGQSPQVTYQDLPSYLSSTRWFVEPCEGVDEEAWASYEPG